MAEPANVPDEPRVIARVPAELLEQFRRAAHADERTISSAVRHAMRRYLETAPADRA